MRDLFTIKGDSFIPLVPILHLTVDIPAGTNVPCITVGRPPRSVGNSILINPITGRTVHLHTTTFVPLTFAWQFTVIILAAYLSANIGLPPRLFVVNFHDQPHAPFKLARVLRN